MNEQEKQELKNLNVEITQDEVNLEDLIILGERKKIPIHISFPSDELEGVTVNARALIRQLTLNEIENLNNNPDIPSLLKKCFFKSTGEYYTTPELKALPLGVINAVARKVLEVSGFDSKEIKELALF